MTSTIASPPLGLGDVSYLNLNAEKALIWRIVHRDNIDWILDHGLHAANAGVRSEHWVSIGDSELIEKRGRRIVPVPPGGVLNDYVPFYFTPFSVMLANIQSGRRGILARPSSEIVVLASSLHRVRALGLPFAFTDKHAYYQLAQFFKELDELDHVDWPLLQRRDCRRDLQDPEKVSRYQAEALIHKHVPVEALVGAICAAEDVRQSIAGKIAQRGLELPLHVRPRWFLR